MGESQIPLEATPGALHYRLKAVEDKIDDLPDQVVNKLALILPTKKECDKRHASDVPWGKILAGVIVTATTIVGAYFGVPASTAQQPAPPAISATAGK